MDMFKGIDGTTEVRASFNELTMSLAGRAVGDLIAQKLADAFMEKFGAEVLAKIDIQTVANLAALSLGGKATTAATEYAKK